MMNTYPLERVKVALDTQLLSYLFDKTYPRLNDFVEELRQSAYVDIVCSRFVIYELIGVRKLEHYLRKIHQKTLYQGGTMNFSSALKNKRGWSAPELDYNDTYEEIKIIIEKELKEVVNTYGVEYESMYLDKEIWNPHKDLVLSSKISKEDSLVLLSSIFFGTGSKEDNLVFLSNDKQFYDSFTKVQDSEVGKTFFDEQDITGLSVQHISNLVTPISNKRLDIINPRDNMNIKDFTKKYIHEYIGIKNEKSLIGKTIKCLARKEKVEKDQMFCFELSENKKLNEDLYLTVLSKDLDTLYNIPNKVSRFECYGKIQSFPYKGTSEVKSRQISVLLSGLGIDKEIFTKIASPNGLVFIHPDSNL